jgi:hypothetical protein
MKKLFCVIFLCSSCEVNFLESEPTSREDKIAASASYLEKKKISEAKKLLLTMIPDSTVSLLEDSPSTSGYYSSLVASLSDLKGDDIILPLLADVYAGEAGISIISFIVALATNKSPSSRSGCNKQENFYHQMAASLSSKAIKNHESIVKAQYLMDTLTISSTYEDEKTAKISALEVETKDNVNTSIAIKAVLYDIMSMVSVMKFYNSESVGDVSDFQVNTVRRAYLHLDGNISNSGSQDTFQVIKNSQISRFKKDIKKEEGKEGISPFDAFSAWIVSMNNNRC